LAVQSSIVFAGQAVSQEPLAPPPPPPANERQHTPVAHDVAVHAAAGPELLVAEVDARLAVDPEPD
jgi:hypothetical protein